jgi:hypothetical protein
MPVILATSGCRDQPWANSLKDPIWIKKITKKGLVGAQVIRVPA